MMSAASVAPRERDEAHAPLAQAPLARSPSRWPRAQRAAAALRGVGSSAAAPLLGACRLRRSASAELWACYVLQFLISLNLYTLSLSLSQLLSSEFGVSDVAAGTAYGLFGLLVSAFSLPCGVVADALGIRISLLLAALLSACGRVALALATSAGAAKGALFSAIAAGAALEWSVLTTAVRRFTPKADRPTAYALLFSVMCLGQAAAGAIRDAFVLGGGAGDATIALHRTSADMSIELRGYRLLTLFGAALALAQASLSGFSSSGPWAEGLCPSATAVLSGRSRTPRPTLVSALRDVAFYRFALLSLSVAAVRLMSYNLEALLPKFVDRRLGDRVPAGTLLAITPATLIFLTPLITATTHRAPALAVILAGSTVAACSLLWLVAAPSLWATVLAMVTLAVGEALWCPRYYEYAASVCPMRASSTWGALASAPLFLARLPAGVAAGELLERYCPPPPARCSRPRVLWGTVAAVAAAGPITLALCYRVVRGPPPSPSDKAQQEEPVEQPAVVYFALVNDPVDVASALLRGGDDALSDDTQADDAGAATDEALGRATLLQPGAPRSESAVQCSPPPPVTP